MKQNDNNSEQNELLTEVQVANLFSVSPRTIQDWRQKGTGPSPIFLTTRKIRYKHSDLVQWLNKKSNNSFREGGK